MRLLGLAWVMSPVLAAVLSACSSGASTRPTGAGGGGAGGSGTTGTGGMAGVSVSSGSTASSSGPASSSATGGVGPCWDGCAKIEMQCMLPSNCIELMIYCNNPDPVYDCIGQCALDAQCIEILQQNSPFAMCVQGCLQGGTGGGGGGSPTQKCINCTQQYCQSDISVCGQVCGSWFNCVQACPDQACVENCNTQTPQALPVYNCGCNNCGNDCGAFCSGMGGAGGTGGSTTSTAGTGGAAGAGGAGGMGGAP